MAIARSFLGIIWAAQIVSSGCSVSVALENRSPNPELPTIEYYEPLEATVHVKPQGPKEDTETEESNDETPKADVDVAGALQTEGVFTDVVSSAHATGDPDFEVLVSYEDESDHHTAGGLAKAILSGLLLRIPSFFQKSEFDYSVTIVATVHREGEEIANYQGVGTFHSEVPKTQAVNIGPKQAQKAVEKSWGHALKEIATAMKQDREKLEKALQEPAATKVEP